MRKVILAALTGAILAGCSGAPVQRTVAFDQADSNHDGEVVLTEWLRYGGAEASFIAADTGRRGRLDETAFRQAVRYQDEASGNASSRIQQDLDTQIAQDIRAALAGSRDVNGWNVKVEVYQAGATLSGSVRSPREKQAAEQLASRVMGVKAVFNQLVIKQ